MSAIPPIDSFNTLDSAELETRLSGPPEQVAAFVRDVATAGSAEAQALYGQLLLDGHGVAANPREALRWFAAAARQGHRLAINMIGRCYDLGWGVGIDKARAAEWYRAAALRGLDWGMYNYGTLLALGQGVPEDRAEALRWFRKAAALGNAKAINFVGSFYEDGWVVPCDLVAAAECYRRAAEGGDFRGAFNHARMLAGSGRIDEALEWLARSGATATPSFIDKACAWLEASRVARLCVDGVRALREAARC
ncbi:MAG: tetratricopeptide repeat protein [Sphingomonadales bacterium]